LVVGVLLISFASTIGALLAFLSSRYLLRDWVRYRFGQKLAGVDAGFERDGSTYLFMLRLVPVFPFFLVNLLMGLTKVRPLTFYWVSQVGMLAGTIVYVNAGTQLAEIDSLSGILSPTLIGSFILLGFFPLLARLALRAFQTRQVYARWTKPENFDRNLVVIGAGAAGLVTAYIAAAAKAKVTLIEGKKMGGDCLNTGCVPSKALIRSAKFLKQASQSQAFGVASAPVVFDFVDVMKRVRRVIETVAPHDSIERYTKLGVEVIEGHARIISPWMVEVNGQCITTRSIVIATGARPYVPPIPGLQETGFHTSDTIWNLTELPQRLVVLGGGPIGCEMSQAFARLGSSVTQVEMESRLMIREDPEVSTMIAQAMAEDGVLVLTGHQAVRVERDGDGKRLIIAKDGTESAIEFDVLLCAVGRVARTEGFGLEELGIQVTPKKTIETDGYLQTIYPNIFVCGDAAGPYQFTHTASHQAWYAAVNALFGQFKRFKADYSVIPWATFTDPEVARVGLSETEAKAQGIACEVTRYSLADLDRAIADEVAKGFVKVLTIPGKDTILGVTIVGDRAGDLIAEYVLAMKHGLGLKKLMQTIHIYPTLMEANKYAAGEWQRNHVPQGLLKWVARYHDWRRR
jgi:pyruvate/2-oxoglutarate dehydrogenase complex dihydrolipoamide dehydrogenase (E3) component/membrane protein DedA with SNARE-associated domain